MIRKKLKTASATIVLSESGENGTDERLSSSTSHFFVAPTPQPFWQQFYEIEQHLNRNLPPFTVCANVTAVYNPTEYAAMLHCQYLMQFLTGPIAILFLGMNPGPWGMCQTGVPFGHVPSVRDWMQLNASVGTPQQQLGGPAVDGLACTRNERSGERFWGVFRDICGDSAETFFRNCFVHNYCPLAFFDKVGRNITPAELKGAYKVELQEVCSTSLARAIAHLRPDTIVCIGHYTHSRVLAMIRSGALPKTTKHLFLNHPSPRARNNNDWPKTTKKWLDDNHILEFLMP